MDWTWVWNFASAMIGGVIGGCIASYRAGQRHGETATSIEALKAAQAHADESRGRIHKRLESGAKDLIDIKVLDVRLDETNKALGLLRETLKEFDDTYQTRRACDERHRRKTA